MPTSVLEDRLRKQLSNLGVTASQRDLDKLLNDRATRRKLTAIDPSYQRTASLADVVGTTLWHTAESATAGLLGLTTDSELEETYGAPWEEKTTAERVGASIGEVAVFP